MRTFSIGLWLKAKMDNLNTFKLINLTILCRQDSKHMKIPQTNSWCHLQEIDLRESNFKLMNMFYKPKFSNSKKEMNHRVKSWYKWQLIRSLKNNQMKIHCLSIKSQIHKYSKIWNSKRIKSAQWDLQIRRCNNNSQVSVITKKMLQVTSRNLKMIR